MCKHLSQRVGFIVGERIAVFIGADIFQTIPNNNSEIGVQRLITLIVDASIQLQSWGIDVHTMFAGTEWGKVEGFESSNSIVKKILAKGKNRRPHLSSGV